MAIYSCNLKSVGRTTHAAGTAGAFIRYISREDSDPVLLAQNMPLDSVEARTWMDQHERAMRKNGRVIDKLRLAIPRELNLKQRETLIKDFMDDLTGGQVSWFAAIHQTGKDSHNPHAHIALHDRSIENNQRVLRLSDNVRDRMKAGLPGPKAVEWLRERWEDQSNLALKNAGLDVRIDRRSLEAQGIDRKPGIHEGPGARHVFAHIQRPESHELINGCGRKIDYPTIDEGRLRREFNAEIIEFNLARAARSGNPVAAAWASFEKQQFAKDSRLEEQLALLRQERTAARRTMSCNFTNENKRLRTAARDETRKALSDIQALFKVRRAEMQINQKKERRILRNKHKSLMARIARRLSRRLKNRQIAARKLQIESHKAQRSKLASEYRVAREDARAKIRAKYRPEIRAIRDARSEGLTVLRIEHREAKKDDDVLRQAREVDREHARRLTEKKIKAMPKGNLKGVKTEISTALDRALKKAQRQEKDRSKDDKGGGRTRR